VITDETDIGSEHDILRVNHQLSVARYSIEEVLERQVEGMLMESILPAGSMRRYVRRVGSLPAHLIEDISSAKMDDRHLHLNELMD